MHFQDKILSAGLYHIIYIAITWNCLCKIITSLHFVISKTRKNCKFCGLWRGWKKKKKKSYISYSIINPRSVVDQRSGGEEAFQSKVPLVQDFAVDPETNTQSLPVNPQQNLQKHESNQPSLSCWGPFNSLQQLSALFLSVLSPLSPVCQNLVSRCLWQAPTEAFLGSNICKDWLPHIWPYL